jgi:hypothetical protein
MIDIGKARRYNEGRIDRSVREALGEAIGRRRADVLLVAGFQRMHNDIVSSLGLDSGVDIGLLDVDGMFGPATLAALFAVPVGDIEGPTPDPDDPMPAPPEPEPEPLARAEQFSGRPEVLPQMIDRRRHATPTYEGRRYTPDVRPIGDVWGWCLHQTAVLYGDEPPSRNDTTGAHFVIRRDPHATILWLHDLDLELWAANRFNSRTISIEVEARACGVEGDPRTLWQPHLGVAEATDAQLRQLERLVHWGDGLIRDLGGEPRVLVAHRQSSRTRRNDPGSRIWSVAMRLQAALGLHDGGEPGRGPASVGTGRPIPTSWNPTRGGIPY